MTLDAFTTDPDALQKSIDRGMKVLDAYDALLKVIPKANETMAFANRTSLSQLLNDWRGDWTTFNDHTIEVVPFETSFVGHRQFFADMGVDTSSVPYLIQQDNKMNLPEIITDAEAKKRKQPSPSPAPLPLVPSDGKNVDTTTKVLMLAGGAVFAFLAFAALSPRKRPVRSFSGLREEHEEFIKHLLYDYNKQISYAQEPARRHEALRNADRLLTHVRHELRWTTSEQLYNLYANALNEVQRLRG